MKQGDRVRVVYTAKSFGITEEMKKYNNTYQTIEAVHNSPNYGIMFTLVGCRSTFDLPFWFVEEWLTPVIEGEEA